MNAITADASSRGYILFEGAYDYSAASQSAHNLSIPGPQTQFCISPTFAVSPNATYIVRYELANASEGNDTVILAQVGGTGINIGDSANSGAWQTFSYTWSSASNTTACLALSDLTLVADGNDFGIEDIMVTGPSSSSVPEPTTSAVFGVALAGLARARGPRR
jgi:hypothetical protein